MVASHIYVLYQYLTINFSTVSGAAGAFTIAPKIPETLTGGGVSVLNTAMCPLSAV
jgi:hypothetical protein